jgi:hypothetical protein
MKTTKLTTAKKAYVKAKKKPLGEGSRFKALTKVIAAEGGVSNPAAVAASIWRKKYGAKKMASLAVKGKKAAKK